MTRLRGTLLALLGLTLLRLPVAALMAALLPDVSVAPEWNYAASIAQSLLMFALPGWLLSPRAGGNAPKQRRLPLWLGAALVCAVLARAAFSALNAWWSALTGAVVTPVPAAQGALARTLQVLALAVVPAIAEEMLFRGALLGNLRRRCGDLLALTLTTLLFALMHGSLAGLPGHLAISLLLTLLMLRGGHILLPVAAHLAYNLLALVWPETAAFVPWVCGGALAAAVVWMALRLPKGEGRLKCSDGLLCGATLAVMAAQYLV